jgi:lambda family phage portal protein
LRRAALATARGLFNVAVGLAGRGRRSVFKGAEMSRLWYDWVASPISADQEIYNDFLRLRHRARELRRNNALIRQYITMLENNVIVDAGLKLQALVRNADGKLAAQINTKIEAAWEAWAKIVTVDCTMGLVDAEHLLLASLAVDGEICIRKIRSYADNKFRFAIQIIDPDLLDHQFFRGPGAGDNQNEIRLGVEINTWGKPVAYWFWDRHPTDLTNVGARKRIRVLADEIIHVFRPDRVNQSRGVTWLNSIMMPTKMLDGYVEAEVVAARIGASKMGFFEWQDGSDYEPPKEDEKLDIEATPGSFEMLPPGLKLTEWKPEHPSTAFPNFLKSIQRWIASALGVSYNAIANDLEGINFSSIRAGLLQERDQWRKLQKFFARRVLHPIYEEWLEFATLSGQLVLDSRQWELFYKVKFVPRGWQWVDPLKDVNSSIAEIDNGLTSRGRVCAEQGEEWADIAEELKEEQDLIEALELVLTGVGIGAGAAAGDAPQNAVEEDQGSGSSTGGDSGGGRTAHQGRVRMSRERRLHLVRSLLTQEEGR